jgi:uncharacterized protein DUF1707
MLIGDAERNRLVSELNEHYVAGRLTLEDLRRRVETVMSAVYLDEARAALAELPAIAGAAPVRTGGRGDGSRAGWFRRKGHAQVSAPEPGWERTDERFRDPSSGVIMRVWVDPADHSRHYVPDEVGRLRAPGGRRPPGGCPDGPREMGLVRESEVTGERREVGFP